MHVEYAFLATAAEIAPDGRMYIMGADFDTLQAKFPHQVPAMALVTKVICTPDEGNLQSHFLAQFLNPEGVKMGPPIESPFVVSAPSAPDRQWIMMLVFGLYGFTLPKPGRYTIRISLNGEEKKTICLFAEEISPST
jgi:hypothetical protein